MITEENKQLLSSIARQAIEHYMKQRENFVPNMVEIPYELCEEKGVFVTLLNKDGEVRGCTGYTEPVKPIWEAVINNAINAAFYDNRFKPLSKEELDQTKIEISILGPLTKLTYSGPKDLVSKINKDMGLVIKKGMHSATYLPEVWKYLREKEDFLENLCVKAGLHPEAWANEKLDVYWYNADIFTD